jgi:hypothetical protein
MSIIGSFADCYASALGGHAAAPPSRVMNVRRFTAGSPPVLLTESDSTPQLREKSMR